MMYKLNKIGGLIVLGSLLFPIIFISTEIQDFSIFVLLWSSGLAFVNFNQLESSGFYFMPDLFMVGPMLTFILIYTGIISIKEEPAKLKRLGIFSFIFTIFYYIWVYVSYFIFKSLFGLRILDILIIPFIGFFGIIVGCSLIIYSSIKS